MDTLTDRVVNLTVYSTVSLLQAFEELEPKALAIPRRFVLQHFDDNLKGDEHQCRSHYLRSATATTPNLKQGNIMTAPPHSLPSVPNP
jgi:hypothetical protein